MLDPKTHARLLEEANEVCRVAGIPRHYLDDSMTKYCNEVEVEWVKSYREHTKKGQFGLVYVGDSGHAQRMMAMCAAFTRNFVMAQVVTVGDLVELMRNNEPPAASVLFIPSFHRPMKQGGLSAFQTNLLWNVLEDRMLSEKQTVIGVQSMSQMGIDYGEHFKQLVQNHYKIVT